MKFLICALAFGLLLNSKPSWADHTVPNPLDATFCSLSARDGIWAFAFDDTSVERNCWAAENAIRRVTFAPIHRQNYGTYSRYGWNEVTAYCYPFNQVFSGRGTEPLQRAYLSLKNYAQDCIFSIR